MVAEVIGCGPGEIVFTGCGTESDNAAIVGAVRRRQRTNGATAALAICSAAEHHAVLHAVEHCDGVVIETDRYASIDLDALAATLGKHGQNVAVVAAMAVNNEVGSITPVAQVAALVRRLAPQAIVHSDAVQAPSWLDLRMISSHVDTLALSAHKFGGPKGTGVLMVRDGVVLEPLLYGGGQERDRRSGTHNVAGIVGLATALMLCDAERDSENHRLGGLRDRLVDRLMSALPDVIETVPGEHKVAGSAHLCIADIENEALLYLLDEAGICASAASACASGAMEPSHVLAAMGVERRWALGALRLTLGRTTTEKEIDEAAGEIIAIVGRLRGHTARQEHVR